MAEPSPALAEIRIEDLAPYCEPRAVSYEVEVENLLAQMTIEEKIGQMTLVENTVIRPEDVRDSFLGGVFSGGSGFPPGNDNSFEAWIEMTQGFQEAALSTRLGIPILYGVDGIHGNNIVQGAVVFPHNVGLGATRNPELVAEIGRVTAIEMNALGMKWNFAPVVAVPQDIRWGRTYEAYGENTWLVAQLSSAFTCGLQGEDLSNSLSVLATPKHFIGDGATVFGTGINGFLDQGDMQVEEVTVREKFLPPYALAVDEGALSIMVSFSSWQGVKMHEQEHLLTDVLKGDLGFAGFLVSDWQAVDQINPDDYYDSVVRAINAGVDMVMVPYEYEKFIETLISTVNNGDVPLARIDDAVRRILRAKYALGLFDHPDGDKSLIASIGSPEHRELARQAVRESLVLLQNRGGALPIDKNVPLILIAGSAADDLDRQVGGWTLGWSSPAFEVEGGTSILAAIRQTASDQTAVLYAPDGQFEDTEIADGPSVGIVVVGEQPYAEFNGDMQNLALTTSEIETIRQTSQRADRTVVIILSGRPMIITDILGEADAWVAAWLPGTEGQGVADMLFGDYAFTGKLPYTWPRSMDQLPFDFDNLPIEGCDAPLFPYGYGLDVSNYAEIEIPDC